MLFDESVVRGLVSCGAMLTHSAKRRSARLPSGPKLIELHLGRMRREEEAARQNARSLACREALLRDVARPVARVAPGE